MKRRRLLLILLLVLLLGSLLLVPSVRWPVYGWLRGEAFYKRIPVSWWKEEVRRYPVTQAEELAELLEDLDVLLAENPGLETFWQGLIGKRSHRPAYQPLLAGGPAAARVLTEMLNESDEGVKYRAGTMLKRIDPEAAARAGLK